MQRSNHPGGWLSKGSVSLRHQPFRALIVTSLLGVAVTWVTVVGQVTRITPAEEAASRVLASARDALGGHARLEAITAMVLEGMVTVTPILGQPSPRPVEVRILWPDKFLQIVRGDRGLEYTGISGKQLLNRVVPPPADERWAREERRVARLLFGMLLRAQGEKSLIVRLQPSVDVGHVLKVQRADGVEWKLTLGADYLPTSIDYHDEIRVPAALPAPLARGRGNLPPVQKVAIRTRFEARTVVDGVRVPTRIVTQTGDTVLEELTLTKITINGRLTPSDFPVPR